MDLGMVNVVISCSYAAYTLARILLLRLALSENITYAERSAYRSSLHSQPPNGMVLLGTVSVHKFGAERV